MRKLHISADNFGLCPGIKSCKAEQDRNKKHCCNHDQLSADLKVRANQNAPVTTSYVMDHEQKQTTETYMGYKGKTDQIGAEERAAVGQNADDRGGSTDQPDSQSDIADARERLSTREGRHWGNCPRNDPS